MLQVGMIVVWCRLMIEDKETCCAKHLKKAKTKLVMQCSLLVLCQWRLCHTQRSPVEREEGAPAVVLDTPPVHGGLASLVLPRVHHPPQGDPPLEVACQHPVLHHIPPHAVCPPTTCPPACHALPPQEGHNHPHNKKQSS